MTDIRADHGRLPLPGQPKRASAPGRVAPFVRRMGAVALIITGATALAGCNPPHLNAVSELPECRENCNFNFTTAYGAAAVQ